MADSWSREEVELTVQDYFRMLECEFNSIPYNKSAHARDLIPLLNKRSKQSIEMKRMNISAVLIQLRFPYIPGYKPYWNFQQLLFECVESQLSDQTVLHALAAKEVVAPLDVPTIDSILERLVAAPAELKTSKGVSETSAETIYKSASVRRIDYLKQEAANSKLGEAGELFVVNFETAKLLAAGKDRLASKIEHVSKTKGDGLGYDILSYDENGREMLIEVKTTRYGAETPFYVSRNENEVSEKEASRFHLYRPFAFKSKPKLFRLNGAFSENFVMEATMFRASWQ